jgi:uncharacterized protein YndB with AHSA1/START domain
MKLDISIEKVFPVALERVWDALTNSALINRWLMTTEDFEAKVGTRFTLRDEPRPGFRGYVECEVLELAPPHRMVWAWSSSDDGSPTRLVIELEAHGDATRLTLRHTGDVDERTVKGTTEGWPFKLGVLAGTLGAPEDLGIGQRSTRDQAPGAGSEPRQLDL